MQNHNLSYEEAYNMTSVQISDEIHKQMRAAMPADADREAWGRMIDQEIRDFMRGLEEYEEEQEEIKTLKA